MKFKIIYLTALIFLTANMNAQQFDFDKKWKEVTSLENEGKTASLQPLVDEIYQKAKSKKATNHVIKALIYQSKIAIITSDDKDIALKTVENFNTEIKNAKPIEKAVLQTLLAKLYSNYYSENNYQINQRSEVENNTSPDFRTWSKSLFLEKINGLYDEAFEQKSKLVKTSIEDWGILLQGKKEYRELYPTLFDVIIRERLSNISLLQDGNSDKKKKLIEEWKSVHAKDENPSAFVNIRLIELEQQGLEPEEYRKKLKNLYQNYSGNTTAAMALYEIANSYSNEKDYGNAKKYAQQAIEEHPKSLGAQNSKNLIEQINWPSLNVVLDSKFLPNQAIPLFVNHKNLNQIYIRIYKVDEAHPDLWINGGFGIKDNNRRLDVESDGYHYQMTHEETIKLQSFDDKENHSTYAALPALSEGNYVLVYANNLDFKGNKKDLLGEELFYVSNYDVNTRTNEIQVLNAQNGAPLKGKKLSFYKKNQSKNENNTTLKLEKTFSTDDFGRIKLGSDDAKKSSRFLMKVEGENTWFNSSNYYKYNKERNNAQNQFQLLTDRAIYRPGQTVYFKGILYKKSKEDVAIATNQKVKIELLDTNRQPQGELELVSNEYGSVHGEFVLPSGGITGTYYIKNDWNNNYWNGSFQVEEYKRPKFSVELDSLSKGYQLNQIVKISGKANAFSGAKIQNAEVTYRVYRQEIFPYFRYWGYPTNSTEEEITFGETITDENGGFKIDFQAIPAKKSNDNLYKSNQNRAFLYRVVADVTDISGETHTATQAVQIGDLPYTLSLQTQNAIAVDDFKSFTVQSNNLNGTHVDAKGTISIVPVIPPDRVFINQQMVTDYQLYSEEEFHQKFPHLAYNNENEVENWKRGNAVFKQAFSNGNQEKIALNKKLPQGYYEIKAISVIGKDTIETAQLVKVFNPKKLKPLTNELFSVQAEKKSVKVGSKAKIQLSSAAPDSHVLIEVEHDGKIIDKQLIALNNSTQIYSFPIEEKHRGGLLVHTYFSKFQNTISPITFVDVPFDNKELDVSVKTIRSTLEPGQEETWELVVKGKNGEPLGAELLANMYDKSLDEFVPHNYSFFPYSSSNYSQLNRWRGVEVGYGNFWGENYYYFRKEVPNYESFDLFGLRLNESRYVMFKNEMRVSEAVVEDAVAMLGVTAEGYTSAVEGEEVSGVESDEGKPAPSNQQSSIKKITPRKNLQETAFFYPDLKTDKEGNVKFSFTTPESLTTWKLMALAHTPQLEIGSYEAEVVTQKKLMVTPNMPRFLREGDKVKIRTKIDNLSKMALAGKATLELLDAFTMQPISTDFDVKSVEKSFTVSHGGSTSVSWDIAVPDEYSAVVYRIVADAGEYADGEESTLPILTNQTLVTETMPIYIREGQSKTFEMEGLKNNKSKTRKDLRLTMKMTTNPIWYAVMALPYLREYPFECSEQIFSRYYANAISTDIVEQNPKIKAVFDDWNRKGELKSPLEKNQDLKNILIEETPWLRDAVSEEEQMKRIALLFDLNTMQNELNTTLQKLVNRQTANGGFSWFEGGKTNFNITAHIVAGIGHLQKMNIQVQNRSQENIEEKAVAYLDAEMEKNWNKYKADKDKKPSLFQGLYWLYARSFSVKTFPLSKKGEAAKNYFLTEWEKQWTASSLYQKAMLALTYDRFGQEEMAQKIATSIKDNAVYSDEMGMYWKENVAGWYWYQAPIETQSLLIEAFDEVANDTESVELMKVWLLKNKQTNRWETTKATTEAVYALLNTGKDWTNAEEGVNIKVGGNVWPSKDVEKQSGSGYVKTSWDASEIKPRMGKVEINKTSPGVAWGAMYWQYFEDLDKVSEHNTNISFKKDLFIQRNTEEGPVLTRVTAENPIKIGDLVKVRLEIQTDRAMEFVHIKDYRASGFEPINVLSQHKRQDGLGYYESTKDAATHFFIDYLPKGVYVFEYELRANNAGDFSNGITQMQNMYAPEFSAHSQGIRVEIGDK